MRYQGNKEKIVDEILPIILEGADPSGTYIEPFCGSCAVIRKVPKTMRRIANDKNPYLIAMHEAIRDGYDPPSIVTEAEYDSVKSNKSKYAKEYVGFVGCAAGFSGQFMGTYARGKKSDGVTEREYVAEFRRSVLEQVEDIQGVEFRSGSFAQLEVPSGAIVYCDPPYEATAGYEYSINNFTEFWKWADALVDRGHKVFVSGYVDTPRGNIKTKDLWQIVWQKQVTTPHRNVKAVLKDRSGRGALKGNTRVEALFHRSIS